MGLPGTRRRWSGELLFNGDRVSVCNDEKVSGDDCGDVGTA